jgi:hypothetical protein
MITMSFRSVALSAALLASAAVLPACASANAHTHTQQPAAVAAAPVAATITEQDVIAAQNAWGQALVQIATTYDTQGLEAARTLAGQVIDSAYGYNLGPVLFKPTLTIAPQTFRTTREGALAYFVGNDPAFPNDTGFALKGWRSYEIINAAIFIEGDVAISMGNVRLTDSAGNVTVVDKTWGWTRDANGQMRIVLHHSSLPHQAS